MHTHRKTMNNIYFVIRYSTRELINFDEKFGKEIVQNQVTSCNSKSTKTANIVHFSLCVGLQY